MMGTIYRNASSVRVWLGPDGQEDMDVISILKSMTSVQGVEDTFGYKDPAPNRMEQVNRFLKECGGAHGNFRVSPCAEPDS